MFKHILVPVAPDHEVNHEPQIATARRLLADGGKISVLSVLDEIPSYVTTYIPESQMEKNLAEVKVDLGATIGGDNVTIHVIAGHSSQTILSWAEQNDVDCIIIASHRPDFSDYFLGSTASRVVRHAQCAVVVLR